MAANLQQQRFINEQLRREVNVPRIQTSKASMLLIKYMTDHEPEDYLIMGFASKKAAN
ncbi:guanine nucleotide-binding protein subunit gamma-1 [Ceratitis capitata]|uniref:guanine nucleotide-binding protein subunit gamma-1 n=1 Tax=Ceratitis capitata TaxID=7213 RepID=UPI0003298D77|nr:guanine nucleotide-binding protein subunit gamma-1 [Ceratitis capitata]